LKQKDPYTPFHRETQKRKKKREELVAQKSEVNPILNGGLTVVGWHIFSACIFNTPPSVIDAFSEGGLALASLPFSGGKSFSSSTVGMHGVKVIRNIKGRCGINMVKSNVSFKVLKMEERI
jgi:hypothetical protein